MVTPKPQDSGSNESPKQRKTKRPPSQIDPEMVQPLSAIQRTIRSKAPSMSREEVRFLVDSYYRVQKDRIRTNHQYNALVTEGRDHEALTWFLENNELLEKGVESLLKSFADGNLVTQWSQSIVGIGPIISAGLYAHIDMDRAETAGAIWRYAGLDPTLDWLGKERAKTLVNDVQGKDRKLTNRHVAVIASRVNRKTEQVHKLALNQKNSKKSETDFVDEEAVDTGEDSALPYSRTDLINALSKRPWNGALKTLCWKIGNSFEKTKNRDADVYGKILAERREYEEVKNENGDYAESALARTTGKGAVGKATVAYKYYIEGRLPPGHLRARSLRYATKIFLSHWHQVAYEIHHGRKAPAPFVISILGHKDMIDPPNWPISS